MYPKMLGILSNIIELTNRRPQGKTHYKEFIKLVFGVTSQGLHIVLILRGGP